MSGTLLGAGLTALTVNTALAGPLGAASQTPLQELQKHLQTGANQAISRSGQFLDQSQTELAAAIDHAPLSAPAPGSSDLPGSGQTARTGQAASNVSDRADPRISRRARFQAILRQAALRHGLDPKLVLALAYWESGWDQSKVSATGAVGLMQVEPASAQSAGPALLGRSVDINNPYDNADVGSAILREDLDNFGDPAMALAAYYQGPDSLRQNGMLPDTQAYVDGILALAARL